jgi:acyl-CoA thioester hydrolase
MARIKITLPQTFRFSIPIAIRITDLNYGGHVGNDAVLSLLHEARVQFLRHHGYEELKIAGSGLIMADVAIQFRKELFYGDTVIASVAAADFSAVGFTIYYKMVIEKDGQAQIAVMAQTAMVCYDYDLKKVVNVPAGVEATLTA